MKNIIKKTHIHPTFFLFLFYFLFTHNFSFFLVFFLSVATHEYGHYFVAKKLGYKLDNFYLAPYGACLNYEEKVFDSKDEMVVAFAGPCINFLLSGLCVCLWWMFPSFYNFSYAFVFQSLTLGLVNLLPCYPLDGGRIVVGLFSQKYERKRVIKILKTLNVIFAMIFIGCFCISCFINFNPSFAIVGAFLLMGNLDWKEEGKYQSNILKNRAKNFSKPMFIYVYEEVTLNDLIKHLEENKHTIFVVEYSSGRMKFIDENSLKLLLLKYPLNFSLAQIVKQEKA